MLRGLSALVGKMAKEENDVFNERGRIKLKESTQDILSNYAFNISGKIKIFCPNCLCFRTESYMRKHFVNCTFIIKGEEIFNDSNIKIIKACNDDTYFSNFFKRFSNLLPLSGGEIRRMNWNKAHEHWILQEETEGRGMLPIGLATLKYSSKLNCHVLFAIILFPENNRGRGLGTLFIDKIQNYYKKRMGIVVESPSYETKKICDKLGLEYYDAP